MKKFIAVLTLMSIFGSFYATAQTIDQDQVIFIVFNYANGIYRGTPENEVISFEQDWYKDRPRYESRFFNGFSDQLKNTERTPLIRTEEQLGQIGEITAPVIRITIHSVDKKGNTRANVSYETSKTTASNTFNSKGGTFGTWLNLFGDGMEHLGEQVATWLRKL